MVALLKLSNRLATEVEAERRMFTRKEVHAQVDGMRLDHTLEARQRPHLTLTLRDLSVGGLSAISDLPLECGERLNVYFPPCGRQHGWGAYGRVLRCEPSSFGYHIAVEFDSLPAA